MSLYFTRYIVQRVRREVKLCIMDEGDHSILPSLVYGDRGGPGSYGKYLPSVTLSIMTSSFLSRPDLYMYTCSTRVRPLNFDTFTHSS